MMLSVSDELRFASRLVIAVLIGGIIGWNRQRLGKPAGLRTHMLVSLGAALIVMIPLQLNHPPSPDAVSRTIQGAATGIGFLGAGEILQRSLPSRTRSMELSRQGALRETKQPQIQGLTSAASIWATAALGLATGCGLWMMSLIGTVLVWLTLTLVRFVEPSGRDRQNED
jgi:putative Mg2+ transporter-C (MgtC) family protein